MGIAIGVLLIAATIASFVAINVRASKMSARRDDAAWFKDPDMAQPVRHRDSGHPGGEQGGGSRGGGHHG